jgi:hypothetical protein
VEQITWTITGGITALALYALATSLWREASGEMTTPDREGHAGGPGPADATGPAGDHRTVTDDAVYYTPKSPPLRWTRARRPSPAQPEPGMGWPDHALATAQLAVGIPAAITIVATATAYGVLADLCRSIVHIRA